MNKALFLDRDGIINEDSHYLYRIEDVRWVKGIVSLCLTAQSLGYKLVVVTNQSGIGRGSYTDADFHKLMDWMRAELAPQGVKLDAVYYCPYHPLGLGEYAREHEDRKPSPGMLLRAARDLDLDLSQSVLVGDRCTDLGAANNAGLRHAFLLRGTEAGICAEQGTAIDAFTELEAWLHAADGV
jgi:D-glycero-D-manno-heptose 1,7-bisphosphate phosphatase